LVASEKVNKSARPFCKISSACNPLVIKPTAGALQDCLLNVADTLNSHLKRCFIVLALSSEFMVSLLQIGEQVGLSFGDTFYPIVWRKNAVQIIAPIQRYPARLA